MRSWIALRGPALAPLSPRTLRRHHRPCAGDPDKEKRRASRVGMAGSSPAMTAEGVTKVGAGRGQAQDEGGCDPGPCHAPPRHHHSRLVITGPHTLRRHHRARPGDPDARSTAPLSSVMAGTGPLMTSEGILTPGLDRGISPGDLDWMKRPSLSASGWSGRAWFQMRVYVEKLSCSSAPARPAGRTLGPDRSGPDCGSAPGSRRRSPYSAGPCHRPAG
jgi:hypothetical protein